MVASLGWELIARLLGVCLTAALARLAWQNRTKRGSADLAALLGSIAAWNALALLPVAGGPARLTLVVGGTMLAVLAVVVYYLVFFALEYSGRGQLITPRRRLLMLAHPGLILLLTLTDQSVALVPSALQQSLLFADVTLGSGPMYNANIDWNSAFVLHLVYTYLLVTASTYCIVDVTRSANSSYTLQGGLALAAIALPWISSVSSFFFGLLEGTLGIAFCATGVLLFVAVRDYDLSDLTPVARDEVLDSIDGGVLVLDEDDQIVDVNPAAKTFLDLEGPVIGEAAPEALSHLDDVWGRYANVYETHDELAIETPVGWRHYVVDISPLGSDEDETARVVLINDVTEQKQREQELENQKEQLDEFASVVSHDLRNPINVANGYTDVLEANVERLQEEYEFDAELVEDPLEEIEMSLGRMETIIDDVLTVARTGQRVTETEAVSIDQLARDAWDTVETGDTTLAVETATRIEADGTRLKRAFENLFRNAVEHGGEAVSSISVGAFAPEAQVFDPEKQGIYVADDGPGIPPDERAAVFESGHTTNPEGTGLGLSIVESVAEAHGWTVTVTESEGGGAQFEFGGVTIHDRPTDAAEGPRTVKPTD